MDPRKVAVTLVCAGEDQRGLEPVIERLEASGYEAELVAGVDTQPRRVGEALDRCGQWGVVVVCVGPKLDRAALRRVEGVFSARHGPDHALVRVELGPPTAAIVATIQRAVGSFAAGSRGSAELRQSERQSDAPVARRFGSDSHSGGLSRPIVRLAPHEPIDGDTDRIELPDNPKSTELSRRRRVARERGRERSGAFSGPHASSMLESSAAETSIDAKLRADAIEFDRIMLVMIIGAGILAVVAALSFSGAL